MPIALLVSKLARTEAERLGAIWSPAERALMWPDDAPRDLVKGWLPRIYKPGATPPHILPKMIPASMFGVNLRSLIPNEWKTISRQFREDFGNRCQVCGGGRAHCHEDWEYIFNPSAFPKQGVQRLRRLSCLCAQCHELKHLGKAGVEGRTEAAMKHLAFINGWSLQQAYEEAVRAWADWKCRNEFRWTLEVSFAEREYGLHIDASPENVAAIQSAAGKRTVPPPPVTDAERKEGALQGLINGPLSINYAPTSMQHDTLTRVAEPVKSDAYPAYERRCSARADNSSTAPGRLALFVVALLGCISGFLLLFMSRSTRSIIVGPWAGISVIASLILLGFLLLLVSRQVRRLLLIGALLTAVGAYVRGVFEKNNHGTPTMQNRVRARGANSRKVVSGR